MDRNEAMLRELNLYPQWTLRTIATPAVVEAVAPAHENAAVELPHQTQNANPQEMAAEIVVPVVADAPFVPAKTWAELKQQVCDCQRCGLRAGCTQTVFGVGDERADWMFVGEGPGADEDAQGEPFVGQAGKLLDNMLNAIKLQRGKKVFIANIVKCRPPNNRNPSANEAAQCMPYLARQIELIQPKLIVALGKVAANNLLGEEATLGSLRGVLHDYQGIPLIITYHPAYLLRSPSEKAKAWEDLCFAVDVMREV